MNLKLSKSRIKLLLISISFYSVSIASASADELVLENWTPKPKIAAREQGQPALFGPKQCTPIANVLYSQVVDYHEAAVFNDDEALAGLHFNILTNLQTISEDHFCFQWIYNFYAAITIRELDPEYKYSSSHRVLVDVATLLFKNLRFRPLTQNLKNDWGGIWKSDPKKILGAYECQESLIYFDPTLKPYNLAAVLTHEFEHLTRDKFSYWEFPAGFVRNVSTALLLDETLSTLHAGYSQLSFYRDTNRYPMRQQKRRYLGNQLNDRQALPFPYGFDGEGGHFDSSYNSFLKFVSFKQTDLNFKSFKKSPRHRYILRSDLNLHLPKGNLFKIWKYFITAYPENNFYLSFSEFFDLAIDLESNQALFSKVIEIVSDAYFEHQGPTVREAKKELDFWKLKPNYVSPMGSLQKMNSDDGKFKEILEQRLNGVSPGCTKITEAIIRGEVPHYIGARLGGLKPEGGEGTRTGQGIKATVPLLPCLAPDEKI